LYSDYVAISAGIGYIFWLLAEIPVILLSTPLLMYVAKGPDGYLIASALMGVITIVIWVPVIVVINVVGVSFINLLIFHLPLISGTHLKSSRQDPQSLN